jgi:hypothetical protein
MQMNGMSNFCGWCGEDIREEDIINMNEMTSEEWLNDIVFTAAKIQKIKAKQLIEAFNKEEILANEDLLRIWWFAFNTVKVRMEREKTKR